MARNLLDLLGMLGGGSAATMDPMGGGGAGHYRSRIRPDEAHLLRQPKSYPSFMDLLGQPFAPKDHPSVRNLATLLGQGELDPEVSRTLNDLKERFVQDLAEKQDRMFAPELEQQQVPQEPVRTGPSAEVLGRILMDKERMFAPSSGEEGGISRFQDQSTLDTALRQLGGIEPPIKATGQESGMQLRPEGWKSESDVESLWSHLKQLSPILSIVEGMKPIREQRRRAREEEFQRDKAKWDLAQKLGQKIPYPMSMKIRRSEESLKRKKLSTPSVMDVLKAIPQEWIETDLIGSAGWIDKPQTEFLQETPLDISTPGHAKRYKEAVAAGEVTEPPREPGAGEFRDAAGNITPGQAPKASTKPEPSGGEKVDVKSKNLPGMGDPTYQKWVKDSERLGITISEHVRNEIAREMGLEKSDINEKISQLSQRLLEALDRKPGWPEILMAWGLMLMGQDGVGFVQQLNQSRLGQVSALQTALQGARGERGRREALGASSLQAQMTRDAALQKQSIVDRTKQIKGMREGSEKYLNMIDRNLLNTMNLSGTKYAGQVGYSGTSEERMEAAKIQALTRMMDFLILDNPDYWAGKSIKDLQKAAAAQIESQR